MNSLWYILSYLDLAIYIDMSMNSDTFCWCFCKHKAIPPCGKVENLYVGLYNVSHLDVANIYWHHGNERDTAFFKELVG